MIELKNIHALLITFKKKTIIFCHIVVIILKGLTSGITIFWYYHILTLILHSVRNTKQEGLFLPEKFYLSYSPQ